MSNELGSALQHRRANAASTLHKMGYRKVLCSGVDSGIYDGALDFIEDMIQGVWGAGIEEMVKSLKDKTLRIINPGHDPTLTDYALRIVEAFVNSEQHDQLESERQLYDRARGYLLRFVFPEPK